MIEFESFTLENGLRVIFHKDVTTPMVAINTLYDVGARDESPDRTGFAHLFEHLMFSGSIHVPNFDKPLEQAGGNNNAFTTNDFTNYYDILPAQNIETALWLESDRMLSLAFTDKSLEVQRNVVIEEFKQNYLNQPYGDLWLELSPLAYKKHPYHWTTIGKSIDHIKNATMEEVKAFFDRYYHPGNAILSIAGNLELNQVKDLVNKWYADIPSRKKHIRNLPKEPVQNEFRTKTIVREVPSDLYVFAYKMPGRGKQGYYEADLISDILGHSKSSRLYKKLKKQEELVTDIDAYITGTIDDGLLVIMTYPDDHVSIEQVESSIWEELEKLKAKPIEEKELEKIINKMKTSKAFEEQGILNKSMILAFHELMGDANGINTETAKYEQVSIESIQKTAQDILHINNCSRLVIKSNEID